VLGTVGLVSSRLLLDLKLSLELTFAPPLLS
jgi:hypothetical protein